MDKTNLNYFAVTAPGLAAITAAEISALGLKIDKLPSGKTDPGGVSFHGNFQDLYKANLHLRTANRILVRFARFPAVSFAELREKAARLSWEIYLKAGSPIHIRVTCHNSKLYHSGAVAERIAGAIEDRLKVPVSSQKLDEETDEVPPQLIAVRLDQDVCTVSIDSSGALLSRRGYRLALAKAPLRETLAAAMILAAKWDMKSPLLDPFCGSGTIPIEAALLAGNIAPGRNRPFAFINWPTYRPEIWQDCLQAADEAVQPGCAPIYGSDRDTGAVQMAQANAERAGVSQWIQFTCQAVSAIQPPAGPGWMVTNPPYGVRVSQEKDLRNLYDQLGKVLQAKCPGWHAAYLCNDEKLATLTRLNFEPGLSFINGGIPVKLSIGTVKKR